MPQYPYPSYQASFGNVFPSVDTIDNQCVDSLSVAQVVPSFITEGFGRVVEPLPRVTYDVLEGWNLALLGLLLLLIVLNKQLYPRQFRQVLAVPGGVAHTNQLLREWTPTGSFLGMSFLLAYVAIMTLFVQKSCAILTRDVVSYNGLSVFSMVGGGVLIWDLLRYAVLYFVNWLFGAKETVSRQMTVQLAVSTYAIIFMIPVLLLLLYNPYSAFVWIGVGIILIAAVVRLVLGMVETRVATKIPAFYIFLYLCALEIAPVATLLTAGLRYIGKGSVF
ncbi:MAG: DUF4271 domain-containing protein [Bacteroidales bacterium]|nr:DUF4271 domain-containing protein [Bacteroidales bacterium]